MASSSTSHRVWRLDEHTVDRYDRFGRSCATGRCSGLPTHAIYWEYVTGRAGRISDTERHVCTDHGQKFAAKHSLAVGEPQPPRSNPVGEAFAAMTGGTVHDVRVHQTRGGSWYLEEHRPGRGLFSTVNHWLSGIDRGAPLGDVITEAETALAQRLLVAIRPWVCADNAATANVAPAYLTAAWRSQPWKLTVACDAGGMWNLTRVLHEQFTPIVHKLGNHNMTPDRALQVANDVLDAERWIGLGRWYRVGDVAQRFAAHPDQVLQHQPPQEISP